MLRDYADEYIQNLCRNKIVADIGCMGSTVDVIGKVHLKNTRFAKEAYGIDINKEFIKIALAKGLKNILYGDVSKSEFINDFGDRKNYFDIVLATEIIEHVDNLGIFLDNIYFLLKKTGIVFLTTPNMICPKWTYVMKKTKDLRVHDEHVCWFDKNTITVLLKRHNFKIKEFFYLEPCGKHERFNEQNQDWMAKKIAVLAEKNI
ncbi:MAG: bifunctional 3-demethylubiquinone-9 3-methyltransferase/ 2-octaprenyl-6-hydroxy phenol methylase [candidate division CPR1 bacterium ADurb.Bin160]|uniref:Bifunctional 3-demethylubiquinone-9 3-methyltransferase/ 2-octaprenyl-6-hydroxy phenol methylase n=1 Tax=candidate division CPR1 bacterium ADurb.Bin160 TaxID=1852826 RepID=A0A1V5ZLN1_9BACT|nr:MAG: bifunctional 3-demethylubiquinone-9 3-methyltransferase/ 2-octaprenyl-6-hydroxy phenol methylase [candidate division CPR1 bacterium ADurb.Bin160]